MDEIDMDNKIKIIKSIRGSYVVTNLTLTICKANLVVNSTLAATSIWF